MKRILTILILCLLVGCAIKEPIQKPVQPTQPVEDVKPVEQDPIIQQPKPIEQPVDVIVEEVDSNVLYVDVGTSFDPKELNIKKGTTVVWINKGHAVHRFIGKTIPYDSSRTFKLERLEPGMSVNYTFEEDGTYTIYSASFQALKGNVIVGNAVYDINEQAIIVN